MNEDRVAGSVRNLGGKAQEGLGRVVGDTKTEAHGVANQIAGAAQEAYGHARDGAAKVADTARDAGSSFEQLLRDTIEQQPYTAVAIALGLGWFLGRLHRPL
jgi:uncharacterized protein YjbJ (UPF0337 family)